MKSITIKGSQRESVGKVATKAVRNAGMVPCVIYGGSQPIHFAAEEKAFKSLVYTPNAHTVVIDLDGKTTNAVLQDIQFHPVSDRINHIDFFQLDENKEIIMEVPVKVTGTSPGVLAGGKLQVKLKKLKVKALPKNLPDNVVVDISGVLIGKSVKVEALDAKEFEFVTSGNAVVVAVRVTRASAQEEAAAKAAAAAPAAKGGAKAPAAAAKAPAAAAKAPAKK